MAENVKVYRFERFGIENLVMQEEKRQILKAEEVRVRICATSLNYRDLLMIKGLYDEKVLSSKALIPLSDCAGEIIEVGTEVKSFKVGDRVAAIFLQDWFAGECTPQLTNSALGGAIDGVLTTEKIFHQNGLVHLPDHCTYEEGATLPCAAITAWHALVVAGKIKAGDTILLQGTGGVSIFALQFAKLNGARVVITSSSNEKLAKAQTLGADHLINYKENPHWETKVKEITYGTGVDHIIEIGGAKTLSQSMKAVRMGGNISIIGILSGIENSINLLPILMKNIRLQGIFVGSRSMFESMNKAIIINKLRPVIDKVFSFDKAKEAYHYLESAQHFGKVVIKID